MSTKIEVEPSSPNELVICRLIEAPREKVYQAWTKPELLKRWFAPSPWTTTAAELDVRPGGACTVTMRGPEGEEFPNPGVYLEVVPNEKLVFTDAYSHAWEPVGTPFMTVVLTFEDAGPGRTKYTARAKHWSKEARDQHERMGFSTGWATCADQLEALLKSL